MIHTIQVFFAMLCAHALVDFSLQTEWIAKNKNRNAVPVGYVAALHGPMQLVWPHVLTAHALMHGGAVWLATGSTLMGVCETVAHWLIDFCKCEKLYGIHMDQALHVGCKLLWLAWMFQ